MSNTRFERHLNMHEMNEEIENTTFIWYAPIRGMELEGVARCIVGCKAEGIQFAGTPT
jgi:hypothetical protein